MFSWRWIIWKIKTLNTEHQTLMYRAIYFYYVTHYTSRITREGIRWVHLTPISIGPPQSRCCCCWQFFFSVIVIHIKCVKLFIPLLSHFMLQCHRFEIRFPSSYHAFHQHKTLAIVIYIHSFRTQNMTTVFLNHNLFSFFSHHRLHHRIILFIRAARLSKNEHALNDAGQTEVEIM